MRVVLAAAMTLMLMKPEMAMGAVREACRLFVTAVMPGLLPYMVFSAMLRSRMRTRRAWVVTVMGWLGGSPAGARLVAMGGLSGRARRFTLVATATMSPMFLLGTCGEWLGSARAGTVLLASVVAGGALTGAVACRGTRDTPGTGDGAAMAPLSLGAAVEQTARTLLIVCGTMAVWRMLADFAASLCPAMAIPLMALMEVTTGVQHMAQLPLPLALRTALVAGATGFGGAAILAQNRAAAGEMALPVGQQILWQALHGGISFLLALGLMQLCG